MAVLTAQPIYKVYQSDAVNNLQESPGSSTVVPADGSTNTPTPGSAPGILGNPAPGRTAEKLVTPVIQQATSTIANTTGASAGFQADSTPGDVGNALQNDVSAMALGNASVPAGATGTEAEDGLSQAQGRE